MSTAIDRRRPRRLRLLLQTSAGDAAAWHEAFIAALPEADVALWPDVPFAPDYVVAWKPPADLFARCARPRAIFNLGAGVDALLRAAEPPSDVPVIRLEDAGMARQMAEYVTAAVLACYRQLDAYRVQQRAAHWQPLPQRAPESFPVGLLGLGVLGAACADVLGRFGFPLRGWSRTRRTLPGVRTFAGLAELPAMLSGTQALVCLLPLTHDTRGLIDDARLAMLPAGAHLVNVARGPLVVERDLLARLDGGHVASATLDVFDDEPLPAAHPFWHHPRVTVTPHVSAVTLLEPSVAQVAAKIRQLERNEHVSGVIDRRHGY